MSQFNYNCAKCGGSVTKPPVSETNSLGKWRCSNCGAKCQGCADVQTGGQMTRGQVQKAAKEAAAAVGGYLLELGIDLGDATGVDTQDDLVSIIRVNINRVIKEAK